MIGTLVLRTRSAAARATPAPLVNLVNAQSSTLASPSGFSTRPRAKVAFGTPLDENQIRAFSSLNSASQEQKMSVKQKVEDLISNHQIIVFSKSTCPYSFKTKALFEQLGQEIEAIELDLLEDGADIQAYLKDKTRQGTVPNIWINQKFIGGNSDVQALHSKGELTQMLGAKL